MTDKAKGTQAIPLVLVVDDHVDGADLMEQRLEAAGYRTETAYDGQEAVDMAMGLDPDLMLLDMMLPKLNGLQVIERLRADVRYRDLPIIVVSAKSEVADRISGLDAGADDYLAKPVDESELLARVRAMLRMREALLGREQLEAENARLRREVGRREAFEEMIGRSPAMQDVYQLVERVAAASISLLITGESGTGKEMVARAVHRLGARAAGAFVAVNCGALPENLLESELFGHKRGSFTSADADREGVFAAADGGTIFLDEIGDVSPATQARLLRVLQEGEVTRVGENTPQRVDVRVIAATNKDLKAEVRAGRFREDLYFRLNGIAIALPALRERAEDILVLAEHFLELYWRAPASGVPGFAAETKRLLLDYPWPGNVRELAHAMERVAVLHEGDGPVLAATLSPELREGDDGAGAWSDGEGTLKERMGRIERQLLQEALSANGGNQSRTAEKLGISRQGLIKKMNQYGLRN